MARKDELSKLRVFLLPDRAARWIVWVFMDVWVGKGEGHLGPKSGTGNLAAMGRVKRPEQRFEMRLPGATGRV